MLRALLLAAPGAGKGTQGQRLAEIYGVPHLATGDLLRQHVANGTELGLEAKTYMDRGELVPDKLVIDLILARLTGEEPLRGFVLDGFPRSLNQARDALEWGRVRRSTFHAVISLAVGEDELVRRLLERGRQSGRTDDNEVTIRNRLRVYDGSTRPLLDFYRSRGILVEIDGTGPVEDVTSRIRAALDRILGLPYEGTIGHLVQANPRGPGQGDVPGLLRRVAQSLADLGPVEVTGLTLDREPTETGPWYSMSVYFRRSV
ncbi:MAG TPA: adenylate kinase [Acidimicrobiia bacterium]|nr:adenylate kinase [Acidimicrobiia bacterium]